MTQTPRKGDFRELKSKQFPGGACPYTSVEVENRSVFILHPRLKTVHESSKICVEYSPLAHLR